MSPGYKRRSLKVMSPFKIPKKTPPSPALRPLLRAVIMGLALAGCGATCPQIEADRAAFSPEANADDGPHAIFELPLPVVEPYLNAQLKGLAPVPLRVPGLSAVNRALGALTITPTRVRLVPGRAAHLTARLTFAVRHGRRTLFELDADADARPVLRDGAVHLSFGPENLRKIEPRLSPHAADALAEAMHRRLPRATRRFTPKRRLKAVAQAALARVVNGGYVMLRDGPMRTLGPLTRLKLRLPSALPLRKVRPVVSDGILRLEMTLSEPAAPIAPIRETPRRARLRLSASAVTALLNHAMRTGALPARFNEKGKPNDDGPYTAMTAWQAGPRPFKVHVWRTEGTCLAAQLGATPTLSVRTTKQDAAQIVVKVRDGQVERVNGRWGLSAALWARNLWTEAIHLTRRITADVEFELGEVRLKVRVLDATLDNGALTLDLDL